MKWEQLRKDIKEHGLRHSTLSAQMPSESSSVVSNATNGIEPPRDYLSIKKSKKGTLKQVVPDYPRLKNFYTLLWDMKGNEGYINIVAVMQKYFDQAISGNWSYNPENYEDNQVPLSVMAQDLLTTYKLGWKTSYYQNTYDGKKEDEPMHPMTYDEQIVGSVNLQPDQKKNILADTQTEVSLPVAEDDGECEACNI
jgi:ribonucleoside-diphosphate reductase alpha chain